MSVVGVGSVPHGCGGQDGVRQNRGMGIKPAPENSMREILSRRLSESESPDGGSREEMSLSEYAAYIYGEIEKLERAYPRYGGRNAGSVFVYISDAGFEAMKADPAYEKWVLDSIREDFGYAHSQAASRQGFHCFRLIGASKEECRTESWSSGDAERERELLLERKKRQKKRLKLLLEKKLEQERLEKKRLEKERLEKERLEKEALLHRCGRYRD